MRGRRVTGSLVRPGVTTMQLRRRLTLAAAIAVATFGMAVLGGSYRAEADTVLALQEDGGTITLVATGASLSSALSYTGNYGDFTVDVLGETTHNGTVSY